MNATQENLREDIKYTLYLQEGERKDCIYEGVCGDRHCFTTKQTDDSWAYYFLAKKDFQVKGSDIEVLVNQPETTSISRDAEPMEFLQIQASWKRVMDKE